MLVLPFLEMRIIIGSSDDVRNATINLAEIVSAEEVTGAELLIRTRTHTFRACATLDDFRRGMANVIKAPRRPPES